MWCTQCEKAYISDNLAGDKKRIILNITALQQMLAARSYEKMHNLAGITIVNISRNILSYNILQPIDTQEPAARSSDT